MKKIAAILAVLIVTACATVGSKYSTDTDITFNGEVGPMLKIAPIYPASAIEQGMEGSVSMSFIIGEDGKAKNIEVTNSVGEPLEVAAVRALQNALYSRKYSGDFATAVAEFSLNK